MNNLVKTLNDKTMATMPTKRPLTHRTDHVLDVLSLRSSDDHELLESVSLRNMLKLGGDASGHQHSRRSVRRKTIVVE